MATDAITSPAPTRPRKVSYPERDGKPMAETPWHMGSMIELIQGIGDLLAPEPRVFVGGNLFLYFVEGKPGRAVSPDVMVARGVDPARVGPSCKTWEHGAIGPELVVEASSPSTRREDFRGKFLLYRDVLRVREYFVFDPLGEYLRPRLQGFRLDGGDYCAIEPVAGRLPSEVLGVHLVAAGKLARLFDPAADRIIPTRVEALAAARRAGRRRARTIRAQAAPLAESERVIRHSEEAVRERDRALERAEAERAELLAEIARLRGGEAAD